MPTPESFHSDSTVAILTGEPCGPLIKLFQNEKFSLKKMLGKDAVSSSSFFKINFLFWTNFRFTGKSQRGHRVPLRLAPYFPLMSSYTIRVVCQTKKPALVYYD